MVLIKQGRGKTSFSYIKFPSLWEFSIAVLIFYAFFFQYGIQSINNAIPLLSLFSSIFVFRYLFYGKHGIKKSFYNLIILFVLSSVLFGGVFGVSGQTSLVAGIRIFEYVLIGLSIYLFSVTHKDRFFSIIKYIWVSITLLVITVIMQGTTVSYEGAVGLETLNSNELSSFLILMVFCCFCLYGQAKNKVWKFIFVLTILITFITQIELASRRGFIVMFFMIIASIVFAVIPYNNENNSRKKIFIYSAFFIIGAGLFVEFIDYVLSSTALGVRLMGDMVGGDLARSRYQAFAFEQFLENPFFGVGLGGVDFLLGVYSHSLFYETLACTGIVGSAILIGAFIQPLSMLIKRLFIKKNRLKLGPMESYHYKIILIYLVSIIVSGIAVVMIYDFYFYISFGLIAAGMELYKFVQK